MRRQWWWLGGLGGALVAVATVAVAVAYGMGGGFEQIAAGAAPAQQDPSGISELAERLISPVGSGPNGQPMSVRLVPGQIAAGLPPDLPVPSGARVVGSAVRLSGNIVLSGDVIIDAPQSASQALAVFDQSLPAHGWTAHPGVKGMGGPAGFQPSQTVTSSSAFCKSPIGPYLNIVSTARSGAPTDLRLHFEMQQASPCGQPHGPAAGLTGNDVLPPLHAPDGVTLQLTGGGGGPNRWTSEANAETDKTVAELEAHYATQLKAAGWTRVAGSSSGPMAWSTWTLPRDGNLTGLLFALEAPGKNHRSLYARVEAPLNGSPGGGSVMYSTSTTSTTAVMAPAPMTRPALPVPTAAIGRP